MGANRAFWVAVFLTVLLGMTAFTHADTPASLNDAGNVGADVIFVAPVVKPSLQIPIRTSVSVRPKAIESSLGELVFLPVDAQVGYSVGQNKLMLSRANASVLRARLAWLSSLDFLTAYRNLDRAIEYGFDVVGFRVPIAIAPNGALVLLPGLETGFRRYRAPIEKTSIHASAVVDAQAAISVIDGWLKTGILGRARYDWDLTPLKGVEVGSMGYLSVLLDKDRGLYARAYTGADFQPSRKSANLPTVNLFTGLSLYGSLPAGN